ncbi:MAG TPA: hypothetical protein DDW94_10430 [Deltaproteobacteria bacterium]|nr:MAG: hypothetical protein A2V21_312185 [Deltaproteobacteria bacterium GWC2_55_46]HBG47387.1 hypothetical protein [Deltaproteobacteria bacterium]HCY11402.1 hypothetical protein [Deltaproteobacteria bacterium]
MYCTEATRLLSEYLDGEISPNERESLESHLNECASCSIEYQALLKIHESFKTRRFHAPSDLDMRIIKSLPERKAVGEEEGLWSIHPVFTRFAGAFTLIVLIAAGAISGSFLSKSLITNANSLENGFATASLSLEVFEPAPRDSAIGADLLMEGSNEK